MERVEVGSRMGEKDLIEEIRELRKLRTAVMVEKCQSKSEAVMCPKPRRQYMRQYVELADPKVVSELSDIFRSKASPSYYSGSPPIRANNPVIQDTRFREQCVQQSPNFGIWIEGLDTIVDHSRRTHSIPTVA